MLLITIWSDHGIHLIETRVIVMKLTIVQPLLREGGEEQRVLDYITRPEKFSHATWIFRPDIL